MEKPDKTHIAIFCIFIFVFGLTSIFCQSVTEGFKAKKMEGKIVKWELEADSARFDENLKTLKGVKVKFYPGNREPFTIKADDGLIKENVPVINSASSEKKPARFDAKQAGGDEIYMENNVQVIGYLNSTIKCNSLLWDSVSEIIRNEDNVEIEAERWNIKGIGIEFSPSGDIITIKKDVTMKFIGQ